MELEKYQVENLKKTTLQRLKHIYYVMLKQEGDGIQRCVRP